MNTRKLNNISELNNQQIKEEIKGQIQFLEINKNENRAYQNLSDAAKAVLTGKCIAINTNNQEGSQINNLHLYRKEIEKELSPKLAEERK